MPSGMIKKKLHIKLLHVKKQKGRLIWTKQLINYFRSRSLSGATSVVTFTSVVFTTFGAQKPLVMFVPTESLTNDFCAWTVPKEAVLAYTLPYCAYTRGYSKISPRYFANTHHKQYNNNTSQYESYIRRV